MRISVINPKFFGKYKHDKRLELEDSSMIVVYGHNESGKSTFVDCAVTLLSAKYDLSLLVAYGEPGTALDGEVSLIENGETLDIAFKSDAKIPKRSTEVQRTPKPETSDVWRKLKNLEPEIIRNLYRVNSNEISDGESTKKKLRQYELGDKRGISVLSKVDSYKELLRRYEKDTVDFLEKIRNLESTKIEVSKTSDEHSKTKFLISETEKIVSDYRADLKVVGEKLQAISFCRGSKGIADEAQRASEALEKSKREGDLVPLEFSQFETLIREVVRSVEFLDHDLGENEQYKAASLVKALEENIDAKSLALTEHRDYLQSNSKLFNNLQYRKDILQKIRGEIASRDELAKLLNESDLQEKQTELDIAERQAQIEKESWAKFGDERTAQQFLSGLDSVQTKAEVKDGVKPFKLVAFSAFLVAIPIFIIGERSGAGVLIALAVVLFFLSRGTIPGSQVLTSDISSEKKQCAGRVIEVDSLVAIRRKDMAALIERVNGIKAQIEIKLESIKKLISELGVNEEANLSSESFGVIEEQVRDLADRSSDLAEAKSKFGESVAKTEQQTIKFEEQKKHLVSTFKQLGETISGDEFNSRDALIGLANSRLEKFEEQKIWRGLINEWEVSLAQQSNVEYIDELRALNEVGWADEEKRLEEFKSTAELVLEEKNQVLFRAQEQKRELETQQLLPQLNLEMSDVNRELRELRINILRLNLQIEMVEKFARSRAEHAKPKLHKSIQEMVLSVADEWNSVNFSQDEQSDSSMVVTVEYKNGMVIDDKKLSAGARSLLFIAMRIAIMKQEAESASKLNFPLLCDDPLLHLDDIRTAQAFKMLKKEAEGHQIIYFTCKEEIRDMAISSGVPVVTIS